MKTEIKLDTIKIDYLGTNVIYLYSETTQSKKDPNSSSIKYQAAVTMHQYDEAGHWYVQEVYNQISGRAYRRSKRWSIEDAIKGYMEITDLIIPAYQFEVRQTVENSAGVKYTVESINWNQHSGLFYVVLKGYGSEQIRMTEQELGSIEAEETPSQKQERIDREKLEHLNGSVGYDVNNWNKLTIDVIQKLESFTTDGFDRVELAVVLGKLDFIKESTHREAMKLQGYGVRMSEIVDQNPPKRVTQAKPSTDRMIYMVISGQDCDGVPTAKVERYESEQLALEHRDSFRDGSDGLAYDVVNKKYAEEFCENEGLDFHMQTLIPVQE